MTDIHHKQNKRFIIDAHSDYAIHLYNEYIRGKNNILFEEHLPALNIAGVKFETIMCGGDFDLGETDCSDPINVSRTFQILKEGISSRPEDFYLVSNSSQLADDDQRIGFIPGIEGLRALQADIHHLDEFFDAGIRNFIITHNEENEFACGCGEKTDSGLSKKGKDLVKKMNNYHLILDLAHISEKSFFQVIDLFDQPVTVSHSNVKKLSNHYRNLTDEQIKLIAAKKGVIGINFLGLFVDLEIQKVNVDRLIDHILYIADLVGIEHVGLGPDYADYYFADIKKWAVENNHPLEMIRYVPGLEKISVLPALFDAMLVRDFNEQEIDLVAGENYLGFYKRVL
ncbi:MAG: membrane dipeptidase [Bacteroidetes bacterium]|nr:membrane dipeptidase [Bacteroidota bacterium]